MKVRKQKYFLLAADWLSITGAFVLAFNLSVQDGMDLFFKQPPFLVTEYFFFLAYTWIVLFIFQNSELYHINIYTTTTDHLQRILKSLVMSVVGLAVISFFVKFPTIHDSRQLIITFFFSSLCFVVLMRLGVFKLLCHVLVSRGLCVRRVLIVGANHAGQVLAEEIVSDQSSGLCLIGFLDDTVGVGTELVGGKRVLGRLSELELVIQKEDIDEVILCNEGESEENYIQFMKKCAATPAMLLVAARDFSVIPHYVAVEYYGDIPVFGMMNTHPYLGVAGFKRAFDIVVAALGILILSPLFFVLGVAIKLESPGPVLYRQRRIGRKGQPFWFYKFRSMYNGSDQDKAREEKLRRFIREGKSDEEATTKIVDHKKTTKIGKFIRKTSIDELPQLINVIKGDMSLIGPRPCLEYEWEHYSQWHKHRADITPGCTGMWQVTGRSEVDFRDMVILDLFYVYNFSFPLDLWLLLKTIPVMLFGIGGK